MDFNSILIGSDDPQRLIAFYTKLLGEPTYRDEAYSSWLIGRGAVTVGAHDEVHGPNKEPGRMIWNIESEDVKADFERFRAAGATVVREPYSFEQFPGTWIATLADPDGNYFQLQTPFDPATMDSGSDGGSQG
jgi:predicted enzyme related to lactoylglutathione lyase